MTTTKKIVTVCLIIFAVIVITILFYGLMTKNNTNLTELNAEKNNADDMGIIDDNNNPPPANLNNLTTAIVAQHSTPEDCWTIIEDKVYDFTNYLNLHPAGPETMIPTCGKDGTIGFNTKGGKGPHSEGAREMLINYYIGNITR